jgi:hypothetical protein
MKDDVVSRDLRGPLTQRQLANGGWPALSSSSQAALEPSALAYIALVPELDPADDRAGEFFLRSQNPNGSWPTFFGDDHEGSWATSLVVTALRDNVEAIPQRLRGIDWLAHSAGEESNWRWKWKFRTTDRHVRFDPDKFGWPWIPYTNSWVVPTAFSILALNQLPCACAIADGERRVELGIEMLLDRACPGGGWNAGNGVVYGSAMAPHPDDTAVALLALVRHGQEPIVSASLDWLEKVAPRLNAPWSLAWCILALAAHHRCVDSLVQRLAYWPDLDQVEDTSSLAVSCLALDHEKALARLGVIP